MSTTPATAQLESFQAALGEPVRPEFLRQNAFRVLWLPAEATLRQAEKVIEKAELMSEMGEQAALGQGPLALQPPGGTAERRTARQRLTQPRLRFFDEFFWLWPLEAGDDQDAGAASALRGDLAAAEQSWRREERHATRGVIARHNLAIASLVQALDLELAGRGQVAGAHWRAAAQLWQNLFADEALWRRAASRRQALDDAQLRADFLEQLRAVLPQLLLGLHSTLAVRAGERGLAEEAQRQRGYMELYGVASAVQAEASAAGLEPLKAQVGQLCTHAVEQAGEPQHDGYALGRSLLGEAKPLLERCAALLPRTHPLCEYLHDEVALAANTCIVTQANRAKTWAQAVPMLEQLIPLADTVSTRAKIQDNLEVLRSNVQGAAEAAVYDTCWYCQKEPAQEEYAYPCPLHQVTGKSYGQIHFNKLTVAVPRCSGCRGAHRNFRWSLLWAYLGGVLVSLIIVNAYAKPGSEMNPLFTALVMGLLALPFLAIPLFFITHQGLRERDNVKKYPPVKKLLAEGWKRGEQPST